MIDFKSLLVERTKCLLYIGGNAPSFFDDKSHLININSNEDYYFYLAFQRPDDKSRAISIFIPREYGVYLESDLYPDCAIKVFEHELSPESTIDAFNSNFIQKHHIQFLEECDTGDALQKNYLLKWGGEPDLIQNRALYYEPLNEDGFNFLFQVDENGYPRGIINGNMPFGFGALYIYARINEKSFTDPIAGFWQHT